MLEMSLHGTLEMSTKLALFQDSGFLRWAGLEHHINRAQFPFTFRNWKKWRKMKNAVLSWKANLKFENFRLWFSFFVSTKCCIHLWAICCEKCANNVTLSDMSDLTLDWVIMITKHTRCNLSPTILEPSPKFKKILWRKTELAKFLHSGFACPS